MALVLFATPGTKPKGWDGLTDNEMTVKFLAMGKIHTAQRRKERCKLCPKRVLKGQEYSQVSNVADRIAHVSCVEARKNELGSKRLAEIDKYRSKQLPVAIVEAPATPFKPSKKFVVEKKAEAAKLDLHMTPPVLSSAVTKCDTSGIDAEIARLEMEVLLAKAYKIGYAEGSNGTAPKVRTSDLVGRDSK